MLLPATRPPVFFPCIYFPLLLILVFLFFRASNSSNLSLFFRCYWAKTRPAQTWFIFQNTKFSQVVVLCFFSAFASLPSACAWNNCSPFYYVRFCKVLLDSVRVLSKSFSVFFLCYRSFVAVISQFLPQTTISQTNSRRADLSRLSVRVRCVPYLLARKCHRCHRDDRQAHFVGNRRASARLSSEFDFLRVARIQSECAFALCLSVLCVCPRPPALFFFV